MSNLSYALLFLLAIAITAIITDRLAAKKEEKEFVGDFSSFDSDCPVPGCGWCFQSKEMLDEHIKENKHGV